MGYSATVIGVLMSIFEISGIIFTLILSKFPSKSGKYGLWLLFLGIMCTVLSFPVLLSPLPVMCIALALFAIPVKSIIPISDAFIHLRLADKSERYGMIRAFGSLGFVVMSFIMQAFVNTDTITPFEGSIWLATPPFLMSVSLFFFPNLLRPLKESAQAAQVHVQKKPVTNEEKQGFFKQFSPHYWLIVVVVTFGYFTQQGTARFFSLYVKEHLGSDAFGFLWALSVICEIPTLFFSYRFIRHFGSKKLILFCVAMISVRSFVYVLFPSVIGATFAQLFHCATFGLLYPAVVVFIAQEVKNAKNAVLAQAISSVGSAGLASVLGSFIGGIVIDMFGYTTMYTLFGFIPLIGLGLYFFLRKRV